MKVILNGLAVASIGLSGLYWYWKRDAWHLDSLAEQYAAHTHGISYSLPGGGVIKVPVLLHPADGAALCDIGAVRLALMERDSGGALVTSFSISSEVPDSPMDVDGDDIVFSGRHVEGTTHCEVLGVPFSCRDGMIEVEGRAFRMDSPALVLIDPAGKVVRVRG